MIKTVIREIIITLLLCVAIVLLLAFIFYDYNPINKVVPNKIAYSVPENIRNELEEESIQNTTLSVENKVYTIEGSDLNIYKRSNTYNPSKENPFASTPSVDSNVTTEGNKINTNTSTNTNTNTQTKNNTINTNSVNTNTSSKPNTGLK